MPPPHPPKPVGVRYPPGSTNLPATTIEVFLDFCCPFSAKMWPTLKALQAADAGVQFVVQLVPQPWHPQSAVLHEVGLSIRELFGDAAFFDYCVSARTRAQLRELQRGRRLLVRLWRKRVALGLSGGDLLNPPPREFPE